MVKKIAVKIKNECSYVIIQNIDITHHTVVHT